MQITECEHYAGQAKEDVQPRAAVCEVCGLEGPLRVCMTCGFVGCCESRNSHDTEHWKQTGHAVIRRLPLVPDSFTWCYEHKEYLH